MDVLTDLDVRSSYQVSPNTDLTIDNVAVSARRGRVTIRSGKGDRYLEIPLNSACRTAMSEWAIERSDRLDDNSTETG